MADDYIPTTDEIREIYVDATQILLPGGAGGPAFDRWLAKHEEEILEEFVPLELVGMVVQWLLFRGSREDLLMADKVNTALGASARRRRTQKAREGLND